MASPCVRARVLRISDQHDSKPSPAKLTARHLRDPWVFAATGFGCGLAPWAPGTLGSALGLAAWWWLLADLSAAGRLVVVAAGCAVAFVAIRQAVKRHGLGDESAIVLDEMIGCWLALLMVPKTLAPALLGFVLFRAADILKPWPVSWADAKVKGAAGILLDDVLAGGIALAALAIGQHVFALI